MLFTTGLDVTAKVMMMKSSHDINLEINDREDRVTLYDHVSRLVSHKNSITAQDMFHFKINSALLLLLAQKVGFVGGGEGVGQMNNLDLDQELELAGNSILNHLCQLIVNSHSISHYISRGSVDNGRSTHHINSSPSFTDVRIATGLYPYISLLNHACEPNVIPTFIGGSLFVLRAMKNIPPGGEIFGCYGVHFARYHHRERSELLYNQYNFKCDCHRCMLERGHRHPVKYYEINCQKCG